MAAFDARPWEAEAQVLWETTQITAREIALKFGVSRNVLLGVAHRRGWLDRGAAPRTLQDRLDAIWAKFEAEMAECKRLQEISRTHWKTHDRHQRDQAAD